VKQCVSVPVNLQLIQSVRLLHAIAESEYTVHLPPSEEWKLAELRRRFPASFDVECSNPTRLPVSIDHSQPHTALGDLARPLVFPQAIASWCRTQWVSARDVHVSFCGLMTRKREAVLQKWLRAQGVIKPPVSISKPWYWRLRPRLPGTAAAPKNKTLIQLPMGPFLLWSSTRGRVFPIKAWDEEYFRVLLRSRFVLCPNGDYVWSYRFFEAMLCGAIPIVEETADAYEGFTYHTMTDATYHWSPELALANYELCRSRITIPREELNAAIAKLLIQ
jgi:hypothetical protein